MKKLIVCVLISALSTCIWSQTFETIEVFQDGAPFTFKTYWDDNEESSPGISSFIFIDSDSIMAIDGVTQSIYHIKINGNTRLIADGGFGYRTITMGKNYITLNLPHQQQALIYQRSNMTTAAITIKLPNRRGYFNPICTGNYLFAGTVSDTITSWELDFTKGTYIFRNPQETMSLLASGLASIIGLKIPYESLRLTSRAYFFPPSSFPVVRSTFDGYNYNANEYKNFGGITPRGFGDYIGTDSKGVYYFMTILPDILINDNYSSGDVIRNPNKRLVFSIADPWSKRIIFRALPIGAWTPPVGDRGLLGSYPASPHPNGEIYFFDGDEKSKTFILKRVTNDWWKELGFDTKQVGIVNDNQVRIRETPSTEAKILGYVYEMEHALVLEKGSKQETIGGQTAYWYKVRLWDNREGWVFGAFLDF